MRNSTELAGLLEPTVDGMGYELLHIEFGHQGRDRILRIYIDAPGGIQVDDCAQVSRQLSAVLDVEDPLSAAYLLEVSSPGLDRPLVKPSHFRQFVGNQAKIVTSIHILGRRRFTGKMIEAGEDAVVLHVDGESYDLPYKDIESARLAPVY
ncbi:MAG: ribosome maturation factor RimP [Gammaproteobacteria bacterium]|nr:ribosome maturation factor RimP [Gammaproteobacteria bacterium]